MGQQMSVLQGNKSQSHYYGKSITLTTKHKKADAFALPLRAGIGLKLNSEEVDTDQLGTFTGEIEREGTPLETAVKKARLGMKKTGSRLGLANEGSFGPHPLMPLIPGCQEIVVMLDDQLGIQVNESIISASTNFCHIEVRSIEESEDFLIRVKFPSHGLIVRPNKYQSSLLNKVSQIVSGKSAHALIHKGIQDRDSLASAILSCKDFSNDGLAHIETDMRAHMNPTRMRVLRSLGVKLARRLRSVCPNCNCPGFGITGAEGFLLCEDCGYPSEAPALEVHSCPKCQYGRTLPRKDGITRIKPMHCQRCNP